MSIPRPEQGEQPAPAFTGASLDRVSTLRRQPEWVAAQLRAPGSVAVAAGGDEVLVRDSPEPRLLRLGVGGLASRYVRSEEPILLGLEDGHAVFAIDLDGLAPAEREPLAVGAVAVSLREAGACLPHSEGGLAAYLMALLNWHRRHRFCSNCGAPTLLVEAGSSRRCPSCGTSHFPRTDPVVIMLVEHDGQLLLGRREGWPRNRYSVLAGFVSPGESLEEAVAREVREESGIHAFAPSFIASQPWPFPSSLMLGFEARADGGIPRARDGELGDVRWFDLEQVRKAAADTGAALQLPPRVSIARFLIERWLARQPS